MTCAEFQRVLPDAVDESWSTEQESHLKYCSSCSSLVSDLNSISEQARTLRASEEPSPRVWNSLQAALLQLDSELDFISREARTLQAAEEPSPRLWNSLEIALRQEGLIRQPQREPFLVSRLPRRWSLGWLAPVAAMVAIAFSVVLYERGSNPSGSGLTPNAQNTVPGNPAVNPALATDDQQVLQAVAARAPAMRATYESNLKNVEAYIRDAEQSARNNPNDEQAQQYLMDAYDQKSMVYEMALDRSLP